ncbi:MAG: hypothetical protein LBS14_01835 [Holosporaceae bacterium]|nr:hypothetical protein [Holosporaceae bacterium]
MKKLVLGSVAVIGILSIDKTCAVLKEFDNWTFGKNSAQSAADFNTQIGGGAGGVLGADARGLLYFITVYENLGLIPSKTTALAIRSVEGLLDLADGLVVAEKTSKLIDFTHKNLVAGLTQLAQLMCCDLARTLDWASLRPLLRWILRTLRNLELVREAVRTHGLTDDVNNAQNALIGALETGADQDLTKRISAGTDVSDIQIYLAIQRSLISAIRIQTANSSADKVRRLDALSLHTPSNQPTTNQAAAPTTSSPPPAATNVTATLPPGTRAVQVRR